MAVRWTLAARRMSRQRSIHQRLSCVCMCPLDWRSNQASLRHRELSEAAQGEGDETDQVSRSASQLRLAASGKWCSNEADSGMAWSQRLLNYGEHLRTSGLQLEADFG